jgi:aminobenzoyl-glutamate utilization protein A
MHLRDRIQGTVKLIFQPAEEGVRGAKSMVGAGVLDDVDFLVGHHVFSGWALGEMVCGIGGYAATHKFDAHLTGAPAHAGSNPQTGKNALQAAATAVLNLYAIPRHGDGATRVNVGRLTAGTGRNVICADAHLVIETRGATSALNDYMCERAVRVLETSARMYACELELVAMGGAQSASSDQALAERVKKVAEKMGDFTFFPSFPSGGSEDITYMMKRVQDRGGLATNIGLGADLHGVSRAAQKGRAAILSAHTAVFDIDERVIPQAVRLLADVVLDLMRGDSV